MYIADSARYEKMEYRKSGHSGLKLPILSLGLWQNFGDYDPIHNQREILRGAFDMGITHFDLANNYGGPPSCRKESQLFYYACKIKFCQSNIKQIKKRRC